MRHWLESVNPDLIEGIHFSIMFYGGSLLAHLEVDDSEVTEFISLARINRHVAVLMDSDRSKSGDRINATKKRVEQEVKDFDGFVWVTKGREIENYLSEDLLREKVKETTANASLPETIGAYGDVFANFKEGRGSRIDKMRLASAVCDTEADLTPLDLRKQIKLLARFITKANDPNAP